MDSLSNIDEVMVYDHSIEEVDIPYFEEVKKIVNQNAKWLFCCHDERKKAHYEDVARRLKVTKDGIVVDVS